MTLTPDQATALAAVLEGQSDLNATVSRMLEGVALTADRFDGELAEIRDGMLALSNRIEALSKVVRTFFVDPPEPDAIHRLPVALTSVADLERERGL